MCFFILWVKNRQASLKTVTWVPSGRHLAAVRVKAGSGVQASGVYPNRRFGCNGMRLRVAINTWRPYVTAEEEEGRTVYRGFSMDLLKILSSALNFTYTVMMPEDGGWGDFRDGRWTGVVGQIERQEVDFSVAPMTPKLERKSVVDWTGPMNIRYTGIALRMSSHNAQLVTALFRPFQWPVYVAVSAVFVFVTTAIYLGIHAESKLQDQQRPSRPDPSVFIIIEFLFGSFIKEIVPSILLHRDGVRRPLIAAWSTFGLLVTTCYTSKLTSLLVDVTPTLPFDSLQGMVASGEYRWGMIDGTALLNSFRYSNNSFMKTAYQGVMNFAKDDPDVLDMDAEVHRAKMASEAYAFIGEEDLQDLWAAEDCSIRVIRERIVGMETYNVFTPKRSVLTQRIDAVLLKLEAGGVMKQLKATWWPTDSPCVRQASSQSAIALPTMQGAFYAAVGGGVLAALALVCERLAGKAVRCFHVARNL